MSAPVATVVIGSPVGPIALSANGPYLTRLRILPGAALGGDPDSHPAIAGAIRQLEEYFAGKRQDFTVPLEPCRTVRGGELRAGIAAIPYGETLSYGALATLLESGPRAVGQACQRNPFPIIIPCHRVTSAKGTPENYSGGEGVATKIWLNDFEQEHMHG